MLSSNNKTIYHKLIQVAILFFCLTALIVGQLFWSSSQARTKNTVKRSQTKKQNGFKSKKKIWVEGHRGARGKYPENTLPAFKYALKVGVDVLELDVMITKDSQIVLSHDPAFSPQNCTFKGKNPAPQGPMALIKNLTLKQVKQYDCGGKVNQINPNFPHQKKIPGTSPPTLKEVFRLVKQLGKKEVKFDIETKVKNLFPEQKTASPDLFVELLLKVIAEERLASRVTIQSFDYRTLALVKQKQPQIKTAQLFEDYQLLDMLGAVKSIKADIASIGKQLLIKKEVQRLQKAGVKVATWTINDEKYLRQAIKVGVDGIITDYPAMVIDYLKKQGLR